MRSSSKLRLLLDDSLHEFPAEALASAAGASPRTRARLFLAETGMTLEKWRTSRRIQEAIRRLAQGASVTDVAFELGYNSASAFTYMFRQNIGVPPRSYRDLPRQP